MELAGDVSCAGMLERIDIAGFRLTDGSSIWVSVVSSLSFPGVVLESSGAATGVTTGSTPGSATGAVGSDVGVKVGAAGGSAGVSAGGSAGVSAGVATSLGKDSVSAAEVSVGLLLVATSESAFETVTGSPPQADTANKPAQTGSQRRALNVGTDLVK